MPGISLKNVKKNYGTSPAIHDLDLDVADGEFLCILGPSGCGKTTMLRMIAGLENLSGGELAVGDKVVDSPAAAKFIPPEKRGMGLVFQSYALWPHLTIRQNTEFGLKLQKKSKAEREAKATEVMEALGIAQYGDRFPSQLSGGQQQRVALARMLAVNPKVLLLDEPLSNLDARLRLEMRTELKRIHKEFNTTIVFVTHDQWEAMTLADRIAVMDKGSLQQLGSPDEIYELPANRFVAEFVGSPPINVLEFSDNDELVESARQFVRTHRSDSKDIGSVCIRPESISIVKDRSQLDASSFSAKAIVNGILPTGGSWIVELRVGDRVIFQNTNKAPSLQEGDQVFIATAVTALNVFDKDGKRMLSNT